MIEMGLHVVVFRVPESSELAEELGELDLSPQHPPDNVGECGTSSGHPDVRNEDGSTEMSSEICEGFTTVSLLSLLINAVKKSALPSDVVLAETRFPEVSEILASRNSGGSYTVRRRLHYRFADFELATRCLIKIVCHAWITKERNENIATPLIQVVRDMEKFRTQNPVESTLELACFLILRCAKILWRFRLKEEALRACDFVLGIIQPPANCAPELALGALLLKNTILAFQLGSKAGCHGYLTPARSALENVVFSFIIFKYFVPISLTGFIRETGQLGHVTLELELVEESLIGALKHEEKADNVDVAWQATILLTLAQYYLKKDSISKHLCCLDLLEQASSGFRRAECRCGPDFMRADYHDELLGATKCPRHRLLVDALILQGIAQSQREGLIEEGKASLEEGFSLLMRYCDNTMGGKSSCYIEFIQVNLLHGGPLGCEIGPHGMGSHGSKLSASAGKYKGLDPSPPNRADTIGECSTSSGQAEVHNEGCSTEMSSEIFEGSTKVNLLLLLLKFADNSALPSDVVATRHSGGSYSAWHAKIELVTRFFINITCRACRTNKDDGNIAAELIQVVRDMKEFHSVFAFERNLELVCFLIFRCAKILWRLGLKEEALRACVFVVEVIHTPGANRTPFIVLGAQLLRIRILGIEPSGDVGIWEELKSAESTLDHSDLGIFLTGFLRPTMHFSDPWSELEMVEESLNRALKHEEEANNVDAARLATIRLTLAQCYLKKDPIPSRQRCLDLLQQAVDGFRQAACGCEPVFMRAGYFEELFGAIGCPCHQLLADVLFFQGIILRDQGSMSDAWNRFEEGVHLVRLCNDEERLFILLSQCFQLRKAMGVGYIYGDYSSGVLTESDVHLIDECLMLGNKIVGNDASGLDSVTHQRLLSEARHNSNRDQLFRDKLKVETEQELHGYKEPRLDQLFSVEMNGVANISQGYNEHGNGDQSVRDKVIVEAENELRGCEERGCYLGIARAHQLLCTAMDDESAKNKQFWLAVKAMEREKLNVESSPGWFNRSYYIEELMHLGQLAMINEIMELDEAFKIWHEVYDIGQKKLESLAQISEDQIFRYFEATKHACMALAKCEHLRDLKLCTGVTDNARGSTIVRTGITSAISKSLIWAERGKGRMSLSLSNSGLPIAGNSIDTHPKYGLLEFERHFRTDDEFALAVLYRIPRNRPILSEKIIFIEYSFLDQKLLMINVISDGCRSKAISVTGDLSLAIDKDTQIEAEKEMYRLSESTRRDAAGTHGSDSTAKPSSSTSKGVTVEAVRNLQSAMNKYETNRAPFNQWIPGMVAGIQRRAAEAQVLRRSGSDPVQIGNKSMHKWQWKEEEIRKLLQKLYAILIEPIKLHLDTVFCTDPKENYSLVFVPHEDLGVVPYAALHEKDGSPYLIQKYAVSVSPAVWISRQLELWYATKVHDSGREGRPLLVGRKSGYPPGYESNPLRHAHDEVDAAARALGRTAVTTVLDDNSDAEMSGGTMKDRVMKEISKASWIHLCVHGEISSDFPQGSLLLGDDDHQRLNADEIIANGIKSRWRARCFIGSACHSGLGSVAGGGIMGFARAFMLAGVSSCVLSLWQVRDDFCTSFTGKLYIKLREGKDIGDAIKSVINTMLDEMEPGVQLKRSRFKGSLQRKWSLLDWAAFSCFGLPGVKLPDSLIAVPESST